MTSNELIAFQQDLIMQDPAWRYIPAIAEGQQAMLMKEGEISVAYISFDEKNPCSPVLQWFSEGENFNVVTNAFNSDKDKTFSVWLNDFWCAVNEDAMYKLSELGFEIINIGEYFKTRKGDVCIPFQLKFNKEQYGL